MPDIIKTVGIGHASTPDYATITLYNAAEGGVDPGVGFKSIAECSGFCGAGGNINGAFARGVIFRGDVTWDGTNDSLLANTERLVISASSGVEVQDLRMFTNNQFVSALNLNADFVEMDRVIFDNTTAGANALDVNGNFSNGHIRNFVARGGVDTIMAGYLQGTNLTNGLVYGAVDKGVEGGGSTPMVLTNILAFNNGGQDIDSAGGFTLNDCATEDGTGTYTGYTSAELVDFVSGNLQTKSTSDLTTLGTPFIGAFLESGGSELSIVGSTPSYSYTVPLANVDLTGELSIVGSTPSYSYTVPLANVDLTGELNIVGSTPSYSYTVPLANVDLTGELNIVGSTPSYSFAVPLAVVDLTGELNIVGSTPSYSYTVPLAVVDLTGDLSIVGTTPTYSYVALRGVVSFSGGACLEIKGDVTLNSKQFSGHDHKVPVACFESISGSVTIDSFNK